MPSSGTAIPENMINPIADPARSELYMAEVSEPFVAGKVSSRKILPVITAGINPDRIRRPITVTRLLRVNMLSETTPMII